MALQSVPRTGGEAVVVVVPPLTHGEQRQPPQVPGAVPGLETAPAETVAQGVDDEGRVPERDGRDAEAPDQELGHRHASPGGDVDHQHAGGQRGHCERDRCGMVVAVEHAELGVAGEVGHCRLVERLGGVGGHPQQVVPEQPVDHRRVRVARPVGMPVVVMGDPPQGPALGGRRRDHRSDRLDGPRHPEGPVGQAAVGDDRDAQDAHRVEQCRHGERDGALPHQGDRQHSEMDGAEGHAEAEAAGPTRVRPAHRAGASGRSASPAPLARRRRDVP